MNILTNLGIISVVIITLIILSLIVFLIVGLNIFIKFKKKDTDFKLNIEVKWSFLKIFHKDIEKIEDLLSDDLEKPLEDEEENTENSSNENKDNIFKRILKEIKEPDDDIKELVSLIKVNLNPIFDFIKTCLRSVSLEKLYLDINLGLSSPVDTVLTVSRISTIFLMPNLNNRCEVYAEPVFTEEVIDFNSELNIKINLFKPFLKFLSLLKRRSILELIWKIKILNDKEKNKSNKE